MEPIKDIRELEEIYDKANPNSLTKVAASVTPLYRQWIEASRFLIISTVGPEGTDASPRGDAGPVVAVLDSKTLLLPDWQGNNRIDSLRNIVRDGRVSLMFMVPGCNNVVRVNGSAVVTADLATRRRFERHSKNPKTVIVIEVEELYFQCAKALMRSSLWASGDESGLLPTPGQFLKEMKADFDGEAYDKAYPARARKIMW